MEFTQLEMFVALVEEGSVRRAADRVYRTQPAVSIAVHKLQGEFETRLFDRPKPTQLRLTQAGKALYQYAKRIIGLRERVRSELNDMRKPEVRRLGVAAGGKY
jgi:DNA-binding transcriptional LysR family regulator